MNKKLLAVLLLCVVPGAVVAERVIETQQRFKNAEVMHETSHDMMELAIVTQS